MLIISCWVHPIPISFQRLMLLDAHGKLQKTIDLIGDSHLAMHERVKRPSRGKKELLIDIEQNLFTTAERTLLIALRTLQKRPEKIDVLWEAIPHNLVSGLTPSQIPFLFYAGSTLEQEFNTTGNAQFINADRYRRSLGPNGIYAEIIMQAIQKTQAVDPQTGKVATFKIIDFKNDLEKIIAHFSDELTHIHQQPELFQTHIKDVWQKYIIEAMLDPLLQHNKDATIHELLAPLSQEAQQILFNNMAFFITDMEMLIKIIRSDKAHIILYAGEKHTNSVSNVLLNNYYYKPEITIKPIIQPHMTYIFPLAHKTWNFLLESPEVSFKKYKAHQRKQLIFDETELEPELYTILTRMNEPEKKDAFIKEQLKLFSKKSHKGYIDFLKAHRADTFETLLSVAIKNNLPKSVEYLVRQGARVNSIDIFGKTPVHYACMLPSPKICMSLLNKGAHLNIYDNDGRTPINYVNPMWKNQKKFTGTIN